MATSSSVGVSGFCSVAGCVGIECSRDGVSGVCSVAKRVGVESWCEVFLIVPFDLPIGFWA